VYPFSPLAFFFHGFPFDLKVPPLQKVLQPQGISFFNPLSPFFHDFPPPFEGGDPQLFTPPLFLSHTTKLRFFASDSILFLGNAFSVFTLFLDTFVVDSEIRPFFEVFGIPSCFALRILAPKSELIYYAGQPPLPPLLPIFSL